MWPSQVLSLLHLVAIAGSLLQGTGQLLWLAGWPRQVMSRFCTVCARDMCERPAGPYCWPSSLPLGRRFPPRTNSRLCLSATTLAVACRGRAGTRSSGERRYGRARLVLHRAFCSCFVPCLLRTPVRARRHLNSKNHRRRESRRDS